MTGAGAGPAPISWPSHSPGEVGLGDLLEGKAAAPTVGNAEG